MTIIDLYETGGKLRAQRLKNGMSAAYVSDALGLSTRTALYKWEKGDSLPTVDHLLDLMHIYKCSLDDLVVYKWIDS